MGEGTKIEWADHTFNPWSGCTKVSPGCANCYAEKLGGRFPHLGNWEPGAERKRTAKANWRKPLAWARKAREDETDCACGCPRVSHSERGSCNACHCDGYQIRARPRVFCASLADWLDPEVPAEWLADLLELIAETPELDWLLLTKRPQLWREQVSAATRFCAESEAFRLANSWLGGYRPPNVWIGTSVEDQQRADERIPHLLQIPARVRFLSCEPLLGPVDLSIDTQATFCNFAGEIVPGECDHGAACRPRTFLHGIHWVIVGGESGPGARPMHPAWARSLRDQCQEAGVGIETTARMANLGKKAAGRELDGRTWDEVPHA